MNPFSAHVSYAALHQVLVSTDGQPREVVAGIFLLEVQYRTTGAAGKFRMVHVSRDHERMIRSSTVRCVRLDVVPRNTLVSRFLPTGTEYIVTGVVTETGDSSIYMPPAVIRARRLRMLAGAALTIAGVGVLTAGWGWVGAVACIAGSHIYRNGAGLPEAPPMSSSAVERPSPCFRTYTVAEPPTSAI